jgi:hypothetical protein
MLDIGLGKLIDYSFEDPNTFGIILVGLLSLPLILLILCSSVKRKKIKKSRDITIDNRIHKLFRKIKYCRTLLDKRVNRVYRKLVGTRNLILEVNESLKKI